MRKLENHKLPQLIIEIKAGNVAAFDELYYRMVPRVYGFLTRLFNDDFLIEEVVQEVFIKLWESKDALQEYGQVEYYIFTIARNRIIDHIKKQKRENEVINKLEIKEKTNSLQEQIYFNDLKSNIEQLINKLPKSQKEIFSLSRYHHLSNKDIAQKLNISERTVEHQIYRALKQLKKGLAGNEIILFLVVCYIFNN